MRVALFALAIGLGCVGVTTTAAAIEQPIRTQAGLLSGVDGAGDELVFKGIPYAAPPVGSLRWKPPQPVQPWQGVRKSDAFGLGCAVRAKPGSGPATGEDCLYLNVWTTKSAEPRSRPVMVWLYGGAFVGGSGSAPNTAGDALARKGAVVVTLNYRLGSLGFLAHPELTRESSNLSSGNYGLLDQLAALRWVQANIAAFGGDPQRVTIFGVSAGSSSVADLMASPLTRGLFHRAIGQSDDWQGDFIGGLDRLKTLAEAEAAGVAWAASKLRVTSLAELRALPATTIAAADEGRDWQETSPIIDGYFLPQDPALIYAAGTQANVPLIAGSVKDEGTSSCSDCRARPKDRVSELFQRWARERFGDLASAFLTLYPANSNAEAEVSQYQAFRDEVAWLARNWGRLQSTTTNAKAYLYYFTRTPPGVDPSRGAYHTAEVPYVFNNPPMNGSWTDVDHRLADTMSSYWFNFAMRGDPNGPGLPTWPAFKEGATQHPLTLGETIAVLPTLSEDKAAFYQRFYDRTFPGRQ